ncbi:monocarboxylate transporter 13-like isoform X1 [Argopecten irradians]|uniref:monocarboxylate transporter 13-like isoform X1 n=1 Tax=Argopecten irradians TaxID=31199 RepID=UPI00371DE11B
MESVIGTGSHAESSEIPYINEMTPMTSSSQEEEHEEGKKTACVRDQSPSREKADDYNDKKMTSVRDHSAPDGGWGWVVVIGSLGIHIIIFGIEKSVGILMKKFTTKFQQSASVTAWVATLPAGMRLLFAPVCSILIQKYQYRPVVLAGSILMGIGLLLTAFSTNLLFTFGCFAIAGGVGNCLVYTPSVVVVGHYFSRRRGLAVGIATSSFGAFLFPTLIEYLFDQYGFRGAFLMLSAIALNTMVCGCVFRPLKTIQKYKSETALINNGSPSCDINGGHLSKPISNKRHTLCDNCVHCCKSVNKYTRKLLDILGNYRYLSFCVAIVMFSIAFQSAYAFIPLYSTQIGITDQDSTYIIAVTILADGLGRIGIGALLDMGCVKQHRIMLYSISLLLVGAVSLILPSTRTLAELLVVCSIYGVLMGGIISQKSVIVVDILGIKKLADAFGLLSFFQGIGVFVGPPITGLLRDIKGDYSYGFYFGGGATVAGATIFFIANVIHLTKTDCLNSVEKEEQL